MLKLSWNEIADIFYEKLKQNVMFCQILQVHTFSKRIPSKLFYLMPRLQLMVLTTRNET